MRSGCDRSSGVGGGGGNDERSLLSYFPHSSLPERKKSSMYRHTISVFSFRHLNYGTKSEQRDVAGGAI